MIQAQHQPEGTSLGLGDAPLVSVVYPLYQLRGFGDT